MAITTLVSPESSRALELELLPGESVLWSGQPSPSIIFHSSDLGGFAFSIFWVGFTAFWEFSATNHGQRPHDLGSAFFAIWGIPFIVIGQYMLWGRFLHVAWRKKRTTYALTTRRVLCVYLGRSRTVVDGYLATLTSVTLSTLKDDFGIIEFSPEPLRAGTWGTNRRNNVNQLGVDLTRLAFFDIENAREVYRLIQAQRDRVQTSERNTTSSS